jgi:hypothetical protein
LLAQIFGVIRDERAELQASMPNMRIPRTRTPASGVPTPVPGAPTGPVPRVDADTGPTGATKRPTSEPSGPTKRPDSEPSNPDAPVKPDEVTPPAIDLDEMDELAKRRKS